MLAVQAFRPVSRGGDQWVPSLSTALLKGLVQRESPPDAWQEKDDAGSSFHVQRAKDYLQMIY